MEINLSEIDHKGLIREAYRIDGITPQECRTIFLDWAISVPLDSVEAVRQLLQVYGGEAPGHPMTAVLRDALSEASQPRRRGGRKGRMDS